MSMVSSVLQGEGFAVSFSHREVTAWGGLALFKQMLDSMGFREAAAHWGLPEPKSNRGYAPLQLIEQFIVSIWCGACRFAHAETVRMDSTLVRLFGWTKAAGHKAIMRLFGRFDRLTNERVQAEVWRLYRGRADCENRIKELTHPRAGERLMDYLGLSESDAYDMGLQIPRGIYSEEAEEGDIWGDTQAPWTGIARVGGAEGMPDSGRAFAARPRAYVHQHTAQAFGVVGSGLYQG